MAMSSSEKQYIKINEIRSSSNGKSSNSSGDTSSIVGCKFE